MWEISGTVVLRCEEWPEGPVEWVPVDQKPDWGSDGLAKSGEEFMLMTCYLGQLPSGSG
jgi:hypothetical protein